MGLQNYDHKKVTKTRIRIMINIVQLWQLAVPLQRQRVVFEQKSYRCNLKRAAQFPVVMTKTFHKPLKSSKNLKGQLGPPVNQVTFLDQRRSVGGPQ